MVEAVKAGRRGVTVKTPAALKLLEGRGNRRDSGGRPVKPAPAFKRLPPDRPGDLSADAVELWDQVVAELPRLELLKPLDGAALRAGCETYARLREAIRMRQEYGLLSENSQGRVTAPWVGVEERASKEFRAWCAEFGLTPAAEGKLISAEAGDGGESNPFAGAG